MRSVLGRVLEEAHRLVHHLVTRGADQSGGACRDCLGPLGHVSEDQDRLAEPGRFFLDPPESVKTR